jgi:hypothetical protein
MSEVVVFDVDGALTLVFVIVVRCLLDVMSLIMFVVRIHVADIAVVGSRGDITSTRPSNSRSLCDACLFVNIVNTTI